jgi:hypothetical protein
MPITLLNDIKAFKPLLSWFRINNTKVHYKILIRGGFMAPRKTKSPKILDNLHLFIIRQTTNIKIQGIGIKISTG